MKWINVKERRPESDELVIVTNIEGDKESPWVCCGYYLSRRRQWYNQFEYPDTDASIIPTHWQPLPKPPKP